MRYAPTVFDFCLSFLFGVYVIETATGGGVAIDVKVHNVAFVLHVVAPLELEVERLVGGEAQCFPRKTHYELVVAQGIASDAGVLPDPFVLIAPLDVHRLLLGVRTAVVHDEVIALPACGLVAIDVDEEYHPIGVGGRGQFLVGSYVKIEMSGVARDACFHQVVAARVVYIADTAATQAVAVAGVAFVGGVNGLNRLPRGPIAEAQGSWRCGRGLLGGTLEPSDAVDELHVIDITLVAPAFNRFNVATMVGVVFVDEGIRLTRPWRILGRVFSGYPLVPTGDEHGLWVELIGPVPLLAEVPAVEVTVFAWVVALSLGETPGESARFVEGTAVTFGLGTCVLADSYRNQFTRTVGAAVVAMLRVVFEPAPLVREGRVRAVDVVGWCGSEGKEVGNGPVDGVIGLESVRLSHDTGFPVAHIPQTAVFPRLIEPLVQVAEGG